MSNEISEPIEISDPRLNHEPLISICVVVHNHAAYLKDAMESLLAQNGNFETEILIGEDCSSDESMEIALKFQRSNPEIVRIITARENVGVFENARRLLRATRGRYIASLDGDDYWMHDKLLVQIEALQSSPETIAVYANAIAVDRSGVEVGIFNDVGTRSLELSDVYVHGNCMNSSSLVYRATMKDEILALGKNLLDYQVQLHLARHGVIQHFSRPLVVYRVNSTGSMVANKNESVREHYWNAMESVPPELLPKWIRARGLADFGRRVFFRSVRTRDWMLYKSWRKRIHCSSPLGGFATDCLIAIRVLWITAKLLFDYVLRRPNKHVLYPR